MCPVAPESCQVLTSSREMYLRMHLGFEPHVSGALKTTAPTSSLQVGRQRQGRSLHKESAQLQHPFPAHPRGRWRGAPTRNQHLFPHSVHVQYEVRAPES